ncbi:glutamine amidotransferase, partial [Patescibacteria group bacterium]
KGVKPFAKIIKGHGNNSEDGTEGVIFKNSIGTYFHGPILARNPHLADYLIAKSLKLDTIKPLDDSLIYSAHTASLKLK